MALPYEHLGPYKLESQIGRGGMGTVFKARHIRSGKAVAVKLIADHVADEPRFRRRFASEIESLQRLDHPGIVKLIGFGEEKGHLFYSMELVEGETLQARIRREKRLDWRVAIDLAIGTTEALKHAHDIGVIHRDLKPANLVLPPAGGVKLVDFGIAKVFGDSSDQTAAGSILGTADYMAPEQAGEGSVTHRTDLYSLGSLIYAMLAGKPPFRGKKVTEVIDALRREKPTPLDLIQPDLPAVLVELVHHLLAKDPADRPPTARVVLNRLKSMRAGLTSRKTLGDNDDLTYGDSVARNDTSESVAHHPTQTPPVGATGTRVSANGQVATGAAEILTVASQVSGATVRQDEVAGKPEGTEAKPAGQTHFQTVDQAKRWGTPLVPSDSSQPSWFTYIGITLMVAVLVIGAGLFYRSTIPPTADELYASASTGDSAAQAAFLRRFPDDDRLAEVESWLMRQKLEATLRRLAAQEKIGVKELSASETGFVAALADFKTQPVVAADRLKQWLAVFAALPKGADQADSANVDLTLTELARYHETHLRRVDASAVVDPRVAELLQRIETADTSDDPAALLATLRGIVETFSDQPWAEPAVELARRKLQSATPVNVPSDR